MSDCYTYKAFGLILRSEVEIAQLPAADPNMEPDVTICLRDLSGYQVQLNHCRSGPEETLFCFERAGTYRITNGSLIEADPEKDCENSLLGVYLMGSCMGAVLHQRGYMPLHGSCVTDGKQSILITGDSGAGKSTLAAEFLAHGWKLLTDDVAAVFDVEGTPTVQSSYPSQKLWQDALKHYDRREADIHSLYFTDERQKFGVNVSECFADGTAPLSMIVRLLPTEAPCSIEPIGPFVRIDQLMQNTYRIFMIAPQYRQRHFRRCAAVAEKVPMMLLTRQEGAQCADQLYSLIVENL